MNNNEQATKWVFFDIGDVLFDEDAPHQLYFHSIFTALRRNGIPARWDDYHDRIRELARTEPSKAVLDAARELVPDEALWDKIYHEGRGEYDAIRKPRPYGVLLDDIIAVLEDLRRDFRLGIIANQHPPVLQALDDYGIGPWFDVKAIDQVVGLSKPDPAFFRWALEQAGCRPEEAIMVGDRPDNDIAPAKSLGMRTVRLRRGILYVYYEPRSEMERADALVDDLARLAPAVRKLAAGTGG